MKKAFTLLELLISVSIIVILSSLVVANYKTGSSYSGLLNFQTALSSDLGLARSKAISYDYHNNEVPFAWGIHLKKGDPSYTIFADLNYNLVPDSNEIYDVFSYNKKMSFGNYYISDISLSDEVSVIFPLNEGYAFFYDVIGDQEYEGELFIELIDEDLNLGKIVIINSFGLIDIADCFCSSAEFYCCSFCETGSTCISY